MRRFALYLAMFLIPACAGAQAPDFNGSFSMEGQNGTIVVTLQATGNGAYAGTMSNGQLNWQLQGEIYEGALTGALDTGQGVLAFEAHISENQLQMIIVEIGPDGVPLVDQGQEFLFTRTQAAAGSQNAATSKPFPGMAGGGGASADPFVGSFSNGELSLTLQGQGGSYNGQMAIGSEAFPVAAQRNGDRVEGTMNAPSGQYGFFVIATADGIMLSNAGNEYALRRVSGGQTGGQTMPGQPGGMAGQGQVDNSPLAQQWRAHLAGKKVTYMDSYSSNTLGGGGISTKFVYHLCSDGRFAYSGSDVISLNSGNPDITGGGSAGSSQGTWRIITEGQLAGIELRFGNGNVETYRLDMQNGQTLANGTRVYVTPGEVCM